MDVNNDGCSCESWVSKQRTTAVNICCKLFCMCCPALLAEDAPAGFEVIVAPAKKGSTVDAACFYTVRGSFAGTKQHELKEAMDEHEAVTEKPLGFLCSAAAFKIGIGII